MIDDVRGRVTLECVGPDAQQIATMLCAYLKEQFEAETQQAVGPLLPVRRGNEVVEVLMLVLSVPPAITATMDLAKRLEMKRHIDAMLAKLKSLVGGSRNQVMLQRQGHEAIDLAVAEPDEIVRALSGEDR